MKIKTDSVCICTDTKYGPHNLLIYDVYLICSKMQTRILTAIFNNHFLLATLTQRPDLWSIIMSLEPQWTLTPSLINTHCSVRLDVVYRYQSKGR